ncbi:hypothetical protein BC628DRAFT_1414184 [Trametes gibbosa]|uniref:RING-type domain-containing protein n=1 Tax=Trametes gibbosa TaxID=160864 RepID=A0A6G6FSB3_9APHY|nr:hypothetical protein C2E23DRAFT_888265 [Lenzites betulinus]KAI0833374.1 hypothetical protein BC628DRAFT_1414184 [Trametes gibbosa]QIE48471.1 hypothetical protein [Trametes gibbosa]
MSSEGNTEYSASAMLHLFCCICNSIFLPDAPPEADPVATPCGHVYHRDCIERVIQSDVHSQPQCHVCAAPLPAAEELLKLFIAFEESDYDKKIKDAVHEATSYGDRSLDAAAAEAECRDKIRVLQSEQEYNVTMLASLETEWSAIEKMNLAAQQRMKDLEGDLADAERQIKELEEQMRAA